MLNPAMTLFEKTQQRFLKNIEDTDNSITKYYNINNPNLTITFSPYEDYYDINIVYDRNTPIFEFPMLPREINEKITLIDAGSAFDPIFSEKNRPKQPSAEQCFSYYKDLFPEGYIFETTKNAVNLLNRVTTSF